MVLKIQQNAQNKENKHGPNEILQKSKCESR